LILTHSILISAQYVHFHRHRTSNNHTLLNNSTVETNETQNTSALELREPHNNVDVDDDIDTLIPLDPLAFDNLASPTPFPTPTPTLTPDQLLELEKKAEQESIRNFRRTINALYDRIQNELHNQSITNEFLNGNGPFDEHNLLSCCREHFADFIFHPDTFHRDFRIAKKRIATESSLMDTPKRAVIIFIDAGIYPNYNQTEEDIILQQMDQKSTENHTSTHQNFNSSLITMANQSDIEPIADPVTVVEPDQIQNDDQIIGDSLPYTDKNSNFKADNEGTESSDGIKIPSVVRVAELVSYGEFRIGRKESSPRAFLEVLNGMKEQNVKQYDITDQIVLVTSGYGCNGSPFGGVNPASAHSCEVPKLEANAALEVIEHPRIRYWWVNNHDSNYYHRKLKFLPLGPIQHCCIPKRSDSLVRNLRSIYKSIQESNLRTIPSDLIYQDPDNVTLNHSQILPIENDVLPLTNSSVALSNSSESYLEIAQNATEFAPVLTENPIAENTEMNYSTPWPPIFLSVYLGTESKMYKAVHREKVVNALKLKFPESRNRVDLSENDYYSTMAQYPLTASPRGLVADCYRHYQALLSGSVPIIDAHHSLASIFSGLPVIYVRGSWTWLTLDEITRQARSYVKYKNQFRWYKLTDKYWFDSVKNSASERPRKRNSIMVKR